MFAQRMARRSARKCMRGVNLSSSRYPFTPSLLKLFYEDVLNIAVSREGNLWNAIKGVRTVEMATKINCDRIGNSGDFIVCVRRSLSTGSAP